ncbi:unnamed protein product [Parnassius apollo]|uniref:(apollo) hypothetical protein n=1 Tax=Parnassius apollo TaxID=110799 RepID=A0A8S3WJM5_PARAO|nr:unnamed protein product [Parnassius apollo]
MAGAERGRGRGRRGRRGGGDWISGRPQAIDEMEIVDINQLQVGEPIERPLHPRRIRIWRPHSRPYPEVVIQPPTPLSPALSLSPVLPSRPCPEVMDPPPSSADVAIDETQLSPTLAPSPGLFVECGSKSTSSTPSRTPVHSIRPRQTLQDDDICFHLNYGSEPESDESDDDDVVIPASVPRTFRLMMDTPTDDHPIDLEQPTDNLAGNPTDAVTSAEDTSADSFYQPILEYRLLSRFYKNIRPVMSHLPVEISAAMCDTTTSLSSRFCPVKVAGNAAYVAFARSGYKRIA